MANIVVVCPHAQMQYREMDTTFNRHTCRRVSCCRDKRMGADVSRHLHRKKIGATIGATFYAPVY